MALSLRMNRGFHCSLSLRAVTIILASFSVVFSLLSLTGSLILFLHEWLHPIQSLHEDFHLDDYEEEEQLGSETSTATEDPEEDFSHNRFLTVLKMSMVFDVINLACCLIDVILSSLLIYGAARRRAAFIKPWFYIGVTMAIYDVVYVIAHWALAVNFEYTMPELIDLAFVLYLLIVAWNLYLDCLDAEIRKAPSPISLSNLVEEGDEQPCSVAYNVLDGDG